MSGLLNILMGIFLIKLGIDELRPTKIEIVGTSEKPEEKPKENKE